MRFFNLGASELFLIFLFAILVVGPKETVRYAKKAREAVRAMQGVFSDLSSGVANIAEEVFEEPKDKS
jgi:Sec-independent protein translocase protein TatA